MKKVGKLAIVFATLLYGVVGIITPEGGSHGPLHRDKRYAPYSRAPLAYMNKLNPASVMDDAEPLALPMGNFYNKRFLMGRDEESMPIRSHFRELLVKDNGRSRSGESDTASDSISGYPIPQRSTRRFADSSESVDPNVALEQLSEQLSPLSDNDLQTILLLMDGYALGTQGATRRPMYSRIYNKMPPEAYYNPGYLTPDDLRRVARLYQVGKREGSGSNNNQGQFFDLENEDDNTNRNNRVEFLTPKRSKRVGGMKIHHDEQSNSMNNRIKKETDPKVEEELERAFNGPRALPLAAAPAATTAKAVVTTKGNHHHEHKAPTAPASSGQIPSPSGASKAKKSIDWSEYFGIDKKNGGGKTDGIISAMKASTNGEPQLSEHSTIVNAAAHKSLDTESSTAANAPSVKPNKAMVASRITEPSKTGLKESKDHKKLRVREENETENKSDRKWILNEFYKNLAMAGNVKRKRDVSNNDVDDLGELEQKMQAAGDEIIWDALKYTGAHKDEPLSPVELGQVKKDIIEKLATAYNLEKIREAIDEFREQLQAIQTNNI